MAQRRRLGLTASIANGLHGFQCWHLVFAFPRGGSAEIIDNHFGTMGPEEFGDLSTNAAASAGDQRYLSLHQ